MLELFESINHWHWLAFGLALLAIELLGTAGYFLWLGLSALMVGIILLALPMSWQLQWVCFGVFSLITTWLWWRRQLTSDAKSDQKRVLNQKEKQLIGQTIIVEEDLPKGSCRIKLGDTTWKAVTSTPIQRNSSVIITDVQGIELIIEEEKTN
ncbi:NfeD family protein [Vibrio amylolyticus]|uniref:NfeD family protein n=1 Tax=Vibrio amylolyticus TaxID=2847292 RepID=UPI00354D9C9D